MKDINVLIVYFEVSNLPNTMNSRRMAFQNYVPQKTI